MAPCSWPDRESLGHPRITRVRSRYCVKPSIPIPRIWSSSPARGRGGVGSDRGQRLRTLKYIEGRKRRGALQAIPQVNREPHIARPQRVPALSVLLMVRFGLGDAVHGKGAGAIEPADVAAAPMEFQKRIAIAAGAVAKIRALDQRPR